MKRSQAKPLKDILRAYVKAQGWSQSMIESSAMDTWRQLMGPTVASKTSNVFLKNGILYINLNSAVLRNELMMMQDQIVARFNEAVGEEVIFKVVLR